MAGSVAGLIQDALSSGVIGVGGLAKTIVGFLAGAIGQQFIVTAALPRLVMFVAATGCTPSLFMGLYRCWVCARSVALARNHQRSRWATRSSGMVAFTVVEGLPGAMERRRLSAPARGCELTARPTSMS